MKAKKQAEDMTKIRDAYQGLLQSDERSLYFDPNKAIALEGILSNELAWNLIESTIKYQCGELVTQKLFEIVKEKDKVKGNGSFRAMHTLSAYLMGIFIRDDLHILAKNLPEVKSKKDKENFAFFWSMICLVHDIAYSIEEETKNNVGTELLNIDGFINKYNITHSLLEANEKNKENKEAALIRAYYHYIAKGAHGHDGHIDHGIAAALLFYNSVKQAYDEAGEKGDKNENGKIDYEKNTYSSKYMEHITLIANTIARHNMWYVPIGDDKEPLYREYGLDALISDPNGRNKISLYPDAEMTSQERNMQSVKENLLFLMGLVDTLEPIKVTMPIADMKDTEYAKYAKQALEGVNIHINYDKREIRLSCEEDVFRKYYEKVKGLEAWLQVSVEKEDDNKVMKIIIPYTSKVHKEAA